MASFGRLCVAFRGAMAFSFHLSMGRGLPLIVKGSMPHDGLGLMLYNCKLCAIAMRMKLVWCMLAWRHRNTLIEH
jgi:hypothetical protein